MGLATILSIFESVLIIVLCNNFTVEKTSFIYLQFTYLSETYLYSANNVVVEICI